MADAEAQELDDQVPDLVEADKPSEAKLTELVTAANLQYSLKNYEAASEIYSLATEMQAELNGEMDPKNAELLFRYGRCLFELAKSKSDVLGGKVGTEKKEKHTKTEPSLAAGGGPSSSAKPSKDARLAEEVVEAKVEEKDGAGPAKADNMGLFQFTVQEDFEDSDEDEEQGQDYEEEDDFATAFEILDIARVLLERQLRAILDDPAAQGSDSKDKGKGEATESTLEPNPDVHKIKELLADTHDQQAEIALENERFYDAVTDFRSTLALRQSIYPKESELLAELHYKLSLALEFASVTEVREAQAQEGTEGAAAEQPAPQVDEELRKEALHEMEAAIESCKLRIAKEQQQLSSLEGEAKAKLEKSIKDVTEMTEEMELRVRGICVLRRLRRMLTFQQLVDLRNPAISVSGGPAGAPDGSNPLAGILGQVFGESTSEQKARIQEATKNANDLTGLVRKKKPAQAPETAEVNGKAKRKLDVADAGEEGDGKRAKTEEPV
jgi:HAT1-interacting factor 1